MTLKNPPKSRSSSGGVPSKTARKDFNALYDQRSEIPPEKFEADKSYRKGIVALFKNTAREWIEDKCPQLGAALAYFTVFSLAPLVLVLLCYEFWLQFPMKICSLGAKTTPIQQGGISGSLRNSNSAK